MQKVAFLGSVASIVGLAITFVSTSGHSGDQITQSNNRQAIGKVEGDVNNYYRSKPARRPRPEDGLPSGFTVDKDGFIRNKSGERICEEYGGQENPPVYFPGGIVAQSFSPFQTRCQLWNGSWVDGGAENDSTTDKLDEWLGIKP